MRDASFKLTTFSRLVEVLVVRAECKGALCRPEGLT